MNIWLTKNYQNMATNTTLLPIVTMNMPVVKFILKILKMFGAILKEELQVFIGLSVQNIYKAMQTNLLLGITTERIKHKCSKYCSIKLLQQELLRHNSSVLDSPQPLTIRKT